MHINFLNDEHKRRFEVLTAAGQVSVRDIERVAMFYIWAGNVDLYRKSAALYDFDERLIRNDWDERADFSSGAQGLVCLSFNLYNGYPANVYNIFGCLDTENRKLAIRAISIRFNVEPETPEREDDWEDELDRYITSGEHEIWQKGE